MSGLMIPHLKEISPETSSALSEQLINSGVRIRIDQINWSDFPHMVDSTVYAGYTDQHLWLHFVVCNDLIRAVCRTDQEPVWQDSCVEFFLKHGDNYHNFEFNCLGVCLSALGPDRHNRKSLDIESLNQILRFPTLSIESLPGVGVTADWSLTIAIPLGLIGLKDGGEFFANFYKCGDETLIPHYISWSAIATPSPDFHRPEFFAPVELV